MHAQWKKIKPNTHINIVGTLETPVWGKPAKRGALLGFHREGTTTKNNQKVLTVQYKDYAQILGQQNKCYSTQLRQACMASFWSSCTAFYGLFWWLYLVFVRNPKLLLESLWFCLLSLVEYAQKSASLCLLHMALSMACFCFTIWPIDDLHWVP